MLDAPCGTGRYFPLVVAAGHRVVGIDQSANMLAEAQRRGLAIDLQHVGLQELSFVERFDAVMTIDAMENVAPEDWPGVLANLHRALRPGGHLYLTVEEHHDVDFVAAHETLLARGLPAVPGEVIDGDVAGYHYYPSREQVIEWTATAGLARRRRGVPPRRRLGIPPPPAPTADKNGDGDGWRQVTSTASLGSIKAPINTTNRGSSTSTVADWLSARGTSRTPQDRADIDEILRSIQIG